MTPLEKVQKLYEDYIDQALEIQKNRHYTDGIFGFGRRSSDDPCHEKFIENLTAQMKEFKENGISSQELREVLSYIFLAHDDHRDPASIYWVLVAAHAATLDVLPLLSQEDAAALYAQYGKLFKRRDRLPVQTKALKLMEKAMRE